MRFARSGRSIYCPRSGGKKARASTDYLGYETTPTMAKQQRTKPRQAEPDALPRAEGAAHARAIMAILERELDDARIDALMGSWHSPPTVWPPPHAAAPTSDRR